MGITIHYRGTMDDIGQIETMEDRVLDLVFALGGRGTLWRSFADHNTSRVVRGLMIELEPGQDTFSLLVSPEGHLTPLFQIEDAEQAPFDEPPYCFIKTQFGSLQGLIAIVHILDALRQKYFSNLDVSDEGEYYEIRDVCKLTEKMRFLREAISSMAEGLQNHGLSEEAAEDPNILASRIERIAMLVDQKMHDLMHKAIGWMLREMGKRDQSRLEKFLKKHSNVMPRTMLRYSIEKLSKEDRSKWKSRSLKSGGLRVKGKRRS